jgi:transglutaminase-like putative cysteine protease
MVTRRREESVKRIRIIHDTAYRYHEPVRFGTHYAMLRPREGHDVHIAASRLVVEPEASIRWRRDIYGNSIAILNYASAASQLRIVSEIDVDLYEEAPFSCLVDPAAQSYPFAYDGDEQIELVPYRLPSYPHDGPALQQWLRQLYQPGQLVDTYELLNCLNTRIFEGFKYQFRAESGVQLPCETLALGSGSCRDYAVFMMEAARHWGFGARFVTGYIQLAEGQHGATHAWTEIYVPGAGWRGYDPTNNKQAGAEHVSVAVAREQDKAMPLAGSWDGPAGSFAGMEVSVQVVAQ